MTQSAAAVLPHEPALQATPVSANRMMLAIAVVSCASLLLELALTRLFSVVLFYHFAFLAISVALLGLGAGGVFAYIQREWLKRWSIPQLGTMLCLGCAILIVIALAVVLHSSISLQLTTENFGRLTILYLAAALPFFTTGLLFSIVFARERQRISRLYGFDLLGGACACLMLAPLLNLLGGPNTILFAGLLMTVAAFFWAERLEPARRAALVAMLLFAVTIGANYSGRLFDIIYTKGLTIDRAKVLFAKWNAISRVEVDDVGGARYISIDADANTAIMNVDPEMWAVPQGHYVWKRDLMKAAPAVVNVLRPHGDFAIIGPGGGVDVLRALANGSPNVTGIEINPAIATTIMRGKFADFAHHLYERPDVHIHVSDGRSFIRSSHEQYDVVQMTLVDTWASTAAGAFALSENNLYTVEAFKEYFQHLRPDGMIAVTRWEFRQPREALRVVSQAMEALHELGVAETRGNFIVVSDGALNQDGRPVLVLAKKSCFTPQEIAAVNAHLTENPNLTALYVPNLSAAPPITPWTTSPDLGSAQVAADAGAFGHLIRFEDPARFSAAYKYNITPVYDSAPFFFFTLKTRMILQQVAGTYGGMDWKVNLGIVILGIVMLVSIACVAAFLVLPLLLHRESRAPHVPPLLYFVLIGLGYILVEITFIQRFVLFLGHPTYALTVVIFLMLLFSGAGSLFARGKESMVRLRTAIAIIVAIALLDLLLLPRILTSLVGLPLLVKLLLSGLLIAPLAFVMGMPFPIALCNLGGSQEGGLTEWAWAMNAAASVLGSVLAMVVAIHFGLSITLLCAAAAYALAMLLSGRLAWS